MSRLERLAAAKGGATRAILRLLGRAAYRLTAVVFNLAIWLLWATLAALGFCASCKTAVERMTEEYIRYRKLRGARL